LADVMAKEERGRVMGAYQTVQGVGNIVGFSALGVMYERISPKAPIIAGAGALAAATSIIALFVGETHGAKNVAESDPEMQVDLADEPFEYR